VCLLAAGCQGQRPFEGVWLVQIGQKALDEVTYVCEENYEDASCPEDGGPGNNDWTYSSETDVSPRLTYAQIVNGPGGEIYLTLFGQIYVGFQDGPDLDFDWKHTERHDDSATHKDGYSYETMIDDSYSTRVRLTRTGKTIEGIIEEEYYSEEVWTETDEWNPNDVGVFSGSLPASVYLEEENFGDADNYADENDCQGGDCSLRIVSTTVFDQVMVGTRTAYEEDAYDGVDQSGQDEGLDGSTL